MINRVIRKEKSKTSNHLRKYSIARHITKTEPRKSKIRLRSSPIPAIGFGAAKLIR